MLAFGAIGAQLQRCIPQAALGLGHEGEGAVAAVDFGLPPPIFRGLLLGLLDQLLDLLFAEVGSPLDAHALLAPRGAVRGGHLQQAVGIDVERHLHLGHPARSGRNAGQPETPQALVAFGHLAFALEHMHLHGALIGFRGAEHIALAHRDRGVAWNQHLHHAADGLQSERQGGDIVEHQIAQLTGEDAGLHRSADGHHFIGVDRLAGFQGDQGAHHLLHHRHAGGATHQHHIVDVLRCESGIAQGPLHRPQQPIEQIRTEPLEHAALQRGFDVQRAVRTGGDEGQRDGRALHPTEFDLGFLCGFRQTLKRLAVAAQVDAVIRLEAVGEPIHNPPIPVISAQLGITAGGLHIEDTLGNSEDRDVEGAPTQVEHQHPFDGAAVKAVGQGCRCGFVEDAFHTETRQPTRITGGLTLGVIEIGGHGDHRRLNRFAEIGAGVIHQLAQDRRHQFLGGILPLRGGANDAHIALVVGPHGVRHRQTAVLQFVPLAANEALEVGEGVAWVEHQLASGQLAHQQFLVLAEAHHRWGGPSPLRTGDHLGAAALQHRHHRVGGAQVDANDPCQLPVRAPGDWVLEPQS